MPDMTAPAGRRLPATARRAEILDAAAQEFQRVGYAGASLDTIAAAVGILKGSLYYHFASKEDILAELLADIHRDALGMLADVDTAGQSALDRVTAYIEAHARWTLRHLDRVEVFLRDYHHLPPRRAREVALLRRRFSGYLADCIAQGQQEGVFAAGLEPRVAANFLLGMLNWLGRWYRPGGGLTEDEVVAQLVRQAARGLTA